MKIQLMFRIQNMSIILPQEKKSNLAELCQCSQGGAMKDVTLHLMIVCAALFRSVMVSFDVERSI